MKNEVIHISAAEAADDFASLLDRVRGGVEVAIEEAQELWQWCVLLSRRAATMLSESIRPRGGSREGHWY